MKRFKIFCPGPEYFPLMLAGQTLTYIPYVMQSSIPSMVSSIWFPANERVIATALVALVPSQVHTHIRMTFNQWSRNQLVRTIATN